MFGPNLNYNLLKCLLIMIYANLMKNYWITYKCLIVRTFTLKFPSQDIFMLVYKSGHLHKSLQFPRAHGGGGPSARVLRTPAQDQ